MNGVWRLFPGRGLLSCPQVYQDVGCQAGCLSWALETKDGVPEPGGGTEGGGTEHPRAQRWFSHTVEQRIMCDVWGRF